METLKRWYIIISVVVFTVAFPIAGRSPLMWGVTAVNAALRLVNGS